MAAFSPLCPPPPLPIPPHTRPPPALRLVFDCVVAGLLTFLSTLALRRLLRRPAPVSAAAFFHPYTSDGGGGERVLWCAVRAVQELCPGLPCAVFTGDADASPDGLAARAIGRFGVRLLRPPQTPALRLVFDCGAPALKKGPWTPEEDKSLREYVETHSEGNWDQIQRNASLNRCGKNCRLRWPNHLRPDLKKGAL